MTRRNRTLSRLLAAAVAAVVVAACAARPPGRPQPRPHPVATSPTPPVARQIPLEREVHGTILVDPYEWLQNREDPETLAYLEAENRYTEAVLSGLGALEDRIYQEILARIQESDLTVPVPRGPYEYYSRTEEGRQYAIHCRRPAGGGEEEVLLDVNRLAEGREFLRVRDLEPSPDQRYLAFAVDETGDERYGIRIKDLGSGELLPEVLSDASPHVAWDAAGRSLFYVVRDETERPASLRRHVLGTAPASDRTVYREPDPAFFVRVSRTRSGRFLVLELASETTTELRLLEADRPEGDFRQLTGRRPGVRFALAHRGEDLFLLTNLDAPELRLVRLPVAGAASEPWETVLAPDEGTTLEAVDAFAGHLVVTERSAGLRRLRVRDLESGEEHLVRFPEAVYSVSLDENPELDTRLLRLQYTSLVTPRSVVEYDLRQRSWTTLDRVEVRGDFDPSRYASERISAVSADGTPVPISLVYRTGPAERGPRPCLLYSYGAYGRSVEPVFSPLWLSLLDRGVIYAIAHVRGGGELGEAWHDQGKLLHKRNSYLDFVAAAEHLVAAGYTTPARLGILGASAGGLVLGAALNERPDLFRAAVAINPFVDLVNTMLDPSIPLTVREYEEWGDPRKPDDFRYMLSYSPYDNVRRQPYPDLLVFASLEDPRVGYWEPAKWIARLRRHQEGDGRLLLRLDLSGGHSGPSGRYDALRDRALVFAFLLDALDVEPVS